MINFYYYSFKEYQKLDKSVKEQFTFLSTSFSTPVYWNGIEFEPFVPTKELFHDACLDFETSNFEDRYKAQIYRLNRSEIIKKLNEISPDKDVDGNHYAQKGKLWIGKAEMIPCTPYGVMRLLDFYNIPLEGKMAVMVGRSNLVGKPLAQLLLDRNCTVTICHSRTKDLDKVCAGADILCVAIGKAKMVKKDWVKEGAVVIDVGMDRDENGKLCGDVDYAEVAEKCSYITPVPGGVGPMTVTMLMANSVMAYKLQNNIK